MTESFIDRTKLLIGEDGVKRLEAAKVLVFGLGGVGSYVTEALARCGVGTLGIVDRDYIAVSNINRQLIALNSTVGEKKTDVTKSRLLDINPKLRVNSYFLSFDSSSKDEVDFTKYDYVVDAIDSLQSKVEIIKQAKITATPVISSMGTGFKLDPSKLKIDDIFSTSVCPLAKLMRKALKNEGITKLKVLYSTENPNTDFLAEADNDSQKKAKIIPSIAFLPSVAGLLIASEVVKDLLLDLRNEGCGGKLD